MQTEPSKSNRRKPDTQTLVNAAWNLARTLLWSDQEFNEAETELAKELIAIHFMAARDEQQCFIAFCEKVQLAFQYINRGDGRYAVHPLKWLNPMYAHGYYGLDEWYKDLKHERLYMPVHRFELRVMAEAYYRFILSPIRETYQQGKKAITHYDSNTYLAQLLRSKCNKIAIRLWAVLYTFPGFINKVLFSIQRNISHPVFKFGVFIIYHRNNFDPIQIYESMLPI